MRTWSDRKMLKFSAFFSLFNIFLVRNQDFVMKTPLWLNSLLLFTQLYRTRNKEIKNKIFFAQFTYFSRSYVLVRNWKYNHATRLHFRKHLVLVGDRHVIRIAKYEFNMKTKNRHKKRYFAVAGKSQNNELPECKRNWSLGSSQVQNFNSHCWFLIFV